jgi:hypothetical protein
MDARITIAGLIVAIVGIVVTIYMAWPSRELDQHMLAKHTDPPFEASEPLPTPEDDPDQERLARRLEPGNAGPMGGPAESGARSRARSRERAGAPAPVPPSAPEVRELQVPFRLTAEMIQGRPTALQMQRFYPARALQRGEEARVTLDCRAMHGETTLACVARDGEGVSRQFQSAAMRVARGFRISSQHANDLPASGQVVEVSVDFRIED